MRKMQEIADEKSCFNRAEPDELVFVLLARDVAASAAIRHWCHERVRRGKNKYSDPQIADAFDCADQMDFERLAPATQTQKGE